MSDPREILIEVLLHLADGRMAYDQAVFLVRGHAGLCSAVDEMGSRLYELDWVERYAYDGLMTALSLAS